MGNILLISADNLVAQSLQAALPAYGLVTHCLTPADGRPHLQAASPPAIILVDARSGTDDLRALQSRHAEISGSSARHIPLIGLIDSAADRAAVLATGADDYLLLPLLPAEVNARLAAHLQPAFASLITLLSIFYNASNLFTPNGLNVQVEQVARHFDAAAAWLLLVQGEDFQLIGSYNLPPMLQNAGTLLEETTRCLEEVQQLHGWTPLAAECPYLSPAVRQTSSGLSYHLTVPLVWGHQLVGVLKLAYPSLPQISTATGQMLAQLGQSLGGLLTEFLHHDETQIYATQNALLVMIAQMISEQRTLDTGLALILEQATPILNAASSEIWLLSKDEAWLTLDTALSRKIGLLAGMRRPADAGLLGWVVQNRRRLHANLPTTDPRFALSIDRPVDDSLRCLVGAPILHHDTLLGVLVMYGTRPNAFSTSDGAFLEGIAALTASAIANARMMEELTDYAAQQRILYEMSQQIAGGLDLEVTLERGLEWLQRLANTEIGLLWLLESGPGQSLKLMVARGVTFSTDSPVLVNLEQSTAAWVVEHGQALVVNDPQNDPNVNQTVCSQLNLRLKNVLSLPVLYHGQAIGVVCLLNKIAGSFEPNDVTLLSTAADMVAVAVGNAQLHTQTVQLVAEREQLYQQMLQTERLATVGRLTASLSHEINNPMQAIQGALALALEELDNPAEVESYIRLSQQESVRVVTLVNRMRQIYRPHSETPRVGDITSLLQEAIAIASKEFKRQKVQLQDNLAVALPPVKAVANQLHLVFLSFILNFAEAIGSAGGGNLQVSSYPENDHVVVKFQADASTITPDQWRQIIKPDAAQASAEISFGLVMSYDIVVAHGGQVDCRQTSSELVCMLKLPVAGKG